MLFCYLCEVLNDKLKLMKLALIQMDIAWGNPKANQAHAEQLILSTPGADVYVLPEMFSTGFCTVPETYAEQLEDSTSLQWMKTTAHQRDAAIAGSLLVTDGEHYYNRFYFVFPDGQYEYYDKRHLFTFGGEHLTFTAGTRKVIVNFRGVRILLQVCYDLRFPIFSRNTPDNPYDLALYVASWPTPRISAWEALTVARALENQCYVGAVNRIGTDPSIGYQGGTFLIDAYGRRVGEVATDTEGVLVETLALEKLARFRKKFPVLNDRD